MSNPDTQPRASIRPYRPEDRAEVLRIGADTAFFGQPVERFMEDRRIFSDFFYSYYTDVESAYLWIAEVDGRVVGFLTGCVDSDGRTGRYIRRVLPGLLKKLLRGGYRIGPRTWNFAGRVFDANLRDKAGPLDLKDYPAHLHINLDASARGRGLGRGLMDAYLGQLRRLEVPGVHLETTSMNEVACRLYESVGFRLLDAHPTRMWKGVIAHPVEDRCYGLRLV